MKKYIFMAVAGLLALSSCSNDDNEELNVKNTPRLMTFSAGFGSDAAQTRATLNPSTLGEANKQVLFDANDQISIISVNNTNTAFSTTESGKSVHFTGYANTDTKYYSVYPYTDGLTLSGTTISNIVIPANQWNSDWGNSETSGTSSWDPTAPVAWTVTGNTSLQFHNLCAILKITISGDWNGTVEISAAQNLAGKFDYDTSTGTYTITDGRNKVTAGDNTHKVSAKNKTLYIAIAPGEYTTFKVRAESTESTAQQRTKSSVEFEKGKIYDLGTFNDLKSGV